MTENDRRLIEDYLPIEAISAEASREKGVRKGHISTLHLWWARRPLVACRAAVYSALVGASQFVPNGASDARKKSLGRANAAKFVKSLCLYPGSPQAIREAQEHLMKAHAKRLTEELNVATAQGRENGWKEEFQFTGDHVSVEDISEGRAPRPRVLDMFAGGGAIPLEALRLGCDAYAMDLNPVAYIIELCTLVYPQKYGQPDSRIRGMTGPRDSAGATSWGGLASEIRYWGNWVLAKVQAEIGDLYPLIPDPDFEGRRNEIQTDWLSRHNAAEIPSGYLMPVAYLWTRTVRCKNPACGTIVPLVRQTWLCKKQGRYAALKVIALKGQKRVRFEVAEGRTEKALGFDPQGFSKAGNATCPFCGAVAENEYVKAEGCAGRLGQQMMAIACSRPGEQGKVYLTADEVPKAVQDVVEIQQRIKELCMSYGVSVPSEPLPEPGTLGFRIRPYGFKTWGNLFNARQMLCLLSFTASVGSAAEEMRRIGLDPEASKAVSTYLAAIVDRLADFNSQLCVFNYTGGRGVVHTFGRHALPMVWDYAESNPFNPAGASWISGIEDVPEGLGDANFQLLGNVYRGSATSLHFAEAYFDAVITDPPYYDNVPYADISDFFYVWLKRMLQQMYPEHFATELTPKRAEAIAEPMRHGGSAAKARKAYEDMMAKAFDEASRVLKTGGQLVVVYAHKTTLGWATLVDALRRAGFVVTEAWPLDTEKPGRLRAQDSAALASSIFLVARKRSSTETGNYEERVRPELEEIVRERVETLWDMGISGADLVISSLGAGLRAFTRFAHVEYANGEEVPAERFLGEVETVVLENILARLSNEVGAKGGPTNLTGVDPATRFYILWRFTYRLAELDAGEAIIFANGTHVELDGPHGLSAGARALVEKKKGKYRLSDFSDRGHHKELGMPSDGQAAPLIDALHRTLWLMENRPVELPDFLRDAQPNRDQMRLVAQALAGPALKGGELADVSPTGELGALAKLTANWRSVIEDVTPSEREARRAGQRALFEKGDNR